MLVLGLLFILVAAAVTAGAIYDGAESATFEVFGSTIGTTIGGVFVAGLATMLMFFLGVWLLMSLDGPVPPEARGAQGGTRPPTRVGGPDRGGARPAAGRERAAARSGSPASATPPPDARPQPPAAHRRAAADRPATTTAAPPAPTAAAGSPAGRQPPARRLDRGSTRHRPHPPGRRPAGGTATSTGYLVAGSARQPATAITGLHRPGR